MAKSNIELIGFRATGKSLVGRTLADRLGHQFVDMDARLTESFGCDITTWVQNHGWESFREAESELLIELARLENTVVATGGGIIERQVNCSVLKAYFFVVWLQASPAIIHSRLTGDFNTSSNRPPLTQMPMREEIEHLIGLRSPLYAEVADLVLRTDEESPPSLSKAISDYIANI